MFHVICIEDLKPVRNPPPGYKCPDITDVVTVERVVNFHGCQMYVLAEFPPVGRFTFIYDAHAFAPIDGPDERELLAERKIADPVLAYENVGAMFPADCFVPFDPVAHARIWKNLEARMNQSL